MTEKTKQIASQSPQWEYEEVDTASLSARRVDYRLQLKKLGEEGWEAYATVAFGEGGLRFFLKRPVLIDPPPDGGRLPSIPRQIDPPPIGGKQGST